MNDVVRFGKFRGMRELALFAGAGGGILGGKMLGWRTVCAVEIEKYPRNILLLRQRDGILDPFPIWDDVCTFDGRPWRGKVDVISGGFPCQDISSAGSGLGIERGERSGLWREYARIIREVRPRYCFVENSPMLTVRGLGIVLGDLAALGYDAAWKVLSAGDCGAPHERARMWIVAKDTNSESQRRDRHNDQSEDPSCEFIRQPTKRVDGVRDEMAYAGRFRLQVGQGIASGKTFICDRERCDKDAKIPNSMQHGCAEVEQYDTGTTSEKSPGREVVQCCKRGWGAEWWKAEPGLGRVADGVANRVDRIKAIGNGQVPIVAARSFCELIEVLEEP